MSAPPIPLTPPEVVAQEFHTPHALLLPATTRHSFTHEFESARFRRT